MLTDPAGSDCVSTVLSPHEAASATSREVPRGQDAYRNEKHVSCSVASLRFAWVIDDAKCILVTRVCLSVCVSVHSHMPTLLHGPRCNLVSGRVCPLALVVQYSADLQSVHGFRCYNNIQVCKFIALYSANAYSAEREMSVSACL